jgi:hypothetical protein
VQERTESRIFVKISAPSFLLLEEDGNNATLPSEWKKVIVAPIYKGG